MKTIIEQQAGFCFGVVRAIECLQKQLEKYHTFYCLGNIVHNEMEVNRLKSLGLKTIDINQFKQIKGQKVIIRAHGEPPSTYELAKQNNIQLIDATCPMVLKLQKDVYQGYLDMQKIGGQVVIFGKKGHAEVVGLLGQTDNTAIIVSSAKDINLIDMSKPIHIFSQTTKNQQDYQNIISLIKEQHITKQIYVTDSICKKVSLRAKNIGAFAQSVDCVLFVSGKDSSNGQYLYNLCKTANKNTFFISDIKDIDIDKIRSFETIGISGATSTPMWLMENIDNYVHREIDNK